MKESLLPSIMITLLAASCGHSGEKGTAVQADTDSAFIEEALPETDSIIAELPVLTADSLGPVRVGMKITGLQPRVPGLYDRITADNSSEGGAHVYSFYLGSEYMFDVFDFGNGTVDVISLQSKRLGVKTPDGLLTIGMPMKNLLAQKGYSTEFLSLDDEGVWYWRYQGLWFSPSLTIPSPSASSSSSSPSPASSSSAPSSSSSSSSPSPASSSSSPSSSSSSSSASPASSSARTYDQALDQALSNRSTPPSAALAADNPIGYIATGSPF